MMIDFIYSFISLFILQIYLITPYFPIFTIVIPDYVH